MKKLKQHYENLIIGFGKGGKTLAGYLASSGREVALIEKSEKMYGGTCINVACIPTKSLITNAEKKITYDKAYDIKNELTASLRKKNFDKLDGSDLVTIITGNASFVSGDQVNVKLSSTGEQVRISADKIFINTGTRPFIPEIPGLKSSEKVFTSESLMEEPVLGQKLVIIGGGFIGLEFADMYAKFGAEVTLLDHGKDFLPKEDRDIAEEILKILNAKKVRVIQEASTQHISDINSDTVRIQYKNGKGDMLELDANAVLVATGRRANIQELNPEAAGIQLDERGYIKVDEHLKTTLPHVWAIGDVNGGPQFTYISLDDFRIIRDQLSGGDYTSTGKRKVVATTVFTTPPLAHIGLREKEAIEKGFRIKVARLPASAIPRAGILNNTEGILKSVIDADTNRILGCTLLCAEASEMINTIQVAMNAGLDYMTIRDTVFTHPSMTEAFNDLYSI
ncbi:MAG TPA: FAD-dependent oxidoreductase [Chryseosolibacter sp.]